MLETREVSYGKFFLFYDYLIKIFICLGLPRSFDTDLESSPVKSRKIGVQIPLSPSFNFGFSDDTLQNFSAISGLSFLSNELD